MTDRLATLMRGEVDTLDVPAAPAPEILAAGQRLRRRRGWTRRAAGAAVLGVGVATVGVVTLGGHPPDSGSASTSTQTPQVSWAVGDTVFLGDGSTTAQMPEVAQSLYYTSAGLLVRTNKDGSSDGGAPFHFELVKADGTTTKLDVTLGEVVPSTDPSEPYLAWATMSGGRIQVVVHDVSSDRDIAKVDVPGTFDWGGWEAPPVSLSGDQVYVGTDDRTEVVDWRTGQSIPSAVVPGSTFLTVHGGHALIQRTDTTEVVDAGSGKVLLQVPGAVDLADLSPDGRFAIVGQAGQDHVYDLESGARVLVASEARGWTYDGDQIYGLDGSTLTTCSVTSGACHDASVPKTGRDELVRYPGVAYES